MRWRVKTRLLTVAALALLVSSAAALAQPVGWVAALEGRGEALHASGGDWTALAAGDELQLGDQLRTLADSRMKLLFRDDSVLTLAANSQLTVDEQVVDPTAPVTRFSLTAGTVRAIVTERYGKPGARFEMETPTAIAGVRGTGFIAGYDTEIEETLVVGLYDITTVRSVIDTAGRRAVALAAGLATRIRRGAYPLRPEVMPETQLRTLMGATDLAGGGTPGGELAPPRSGQKAGKGEGATPANSPKVPNAAVDQPINQLKQLQGKEGAPKPPPPPPPPPPRK
jgi:FecR protein